MPARICIAVLFAICLNALCPFPGWPLPPAPAALITQIQQMIQNGNRAEARAQLNAALRSYPSSAELHNLLGVVEAQSGNYSLAETGFRKAIRLNSRLTPAYLNLGRLYQENVGKDQKAERKGAQIYLELLKIEPDNAEARYQAAYMVLLEGSYLTSLSLLERLPAAFQQKAQVLALRCAAEAGAGRSDRAAATALDLLKSPELAEADILTIQPVLAAKKQWRLETSLLQALEARRMASASSLARLAALYEEQSQLVQARRTLENAASAGPLTAELLTMLARVAYKQQDREGVLGYLAHARDLDPKNAAVHFFFGLVCVEMDLPIEAEKSLGTAVQLDPDNAWYNYALGAVTAQVRKWDSAIPYFEKYVLLRPGDPRGKLALATAHFHSYQEAAARKELLEIVRYPQTAAGAHLYLAKLALRESDFAAAEVELKRSLEANPESAEAYAELGFAYLQQARYAPAREALAHSVKLQPDGVRANMTLLALYRRTADKRADDQATRVRELIQKREEYAKALLRTIDVRPY